MLRGVSLRARLVLAVLVLALVGFAAADIATYASLESFLIQRTDNTLAAQHREVKAQLSGAGGGPDRLGAFERTLPGLFVQARTLSGRVLGTAGPTSPFLETGEDASPRKLPKPVDLPPAS